MGLYYTFHVKVGALGGWPELFPYIESQFQAGSKYLWFVLDPSFTTLEEAQIWTEERKQIELAGRLEDAKLLIAKGMLDVSTRYLTLAELIDRVFIEGPMTFQFGKEEFEKAKANRGQYIVICGKCGHQWIGRASSDGYIACSDCGKLIQSND